jgi:hypothetical protein
VNPAKNVTVADSNQKKKRGRSPKNSKDKEKNEERASTAKGSSEKVFDIDSANEIQNQPPKIKRKSAKVSYSDFFHSFYYYCQ